MSSIIDGFKDAPFFNKDIIVTIGGLGGIGSNVNYILCRNQYNTILYDMDTVEIHNIGSQVYNKSNIGQLKTEAAIFIAEQYGDNTNYNCFGEFTNNSIITNVAISCFDNMKARKIFFEKWYSKQLDKTIEYRSNNPDEINIFIDGRMNFGTCQVFSVKTKNEAEVYLKTLFDDSIVPEQICSYKSSCQTGTLIGSLISIILTNHISNKNTKQDINEVPFYQKFDNMSTMYTNLNYKEYADKYCKS